jgi:hypothetical protein
MGYVAAAVIGYLLGSIPVSLVVARAHGVNLYSTSDGALEPGTRSSSSVPGGPGPSSRATALRVPWPVWPD